MEDDPTNCEDFDETEDDECDECDDDYIPRHLRYNDEYPLE